jgi:hypothetical protein
VGAAVVVVLLALLKPRPGALALERCRVGLHLFFGPLSLFLLRFGSLLERLGNVDLGRGRSWTEDGCIVQSRDPIGFAVADDWCHKVRHVDLLLGILSKTSIVGCLLRPAPAHGTLGVLVLVDLGERCAIAHLSLFDA